MNKKSHEESVVASLKVFAFLLLGACVASVHADAVADFYSGTVPVNDRSQVSFRQGVTEALLQVLVKASAESPEKIRQTAVLQDDLANAERFAAQFLYKTQADAQQDGSVKNQVYLQVGFPEKIIMGLLKKGNLRFWSAHRPALLVLPVINTGSANYTVPPDAVLTESVMASGRKYGLPLALSDADNDAGQLWKADIAYVQQLLSKSGQKFALLIQMASESSTRGKWLLIDSAQMIAADISADSQAGAIDKGMAWAVSAMASKNAVELGAGYSNIKLLVNGVDSYEKYENAIAYLKNISIVEEFSLLKIHNGVISLDLKLRAGIDQLEKILQADKRIQIRPDDSGQKNYHWQG